MQNKRTQVYSTDTHISMFRSVCATIEDECQSIQRLDAARFFFSVNSTVRIGLALCCHRIPDSLKVRPGTHQSPRQGRFSLGLCCKQTSVSMKNESFFKNK